MLSRTASSLYWLGRYIERADFIARLVEATVRLDVLSPRPAGEAAWASALAVTETDTAFAATGETMTQQHVVRFLTAGARVKVTIMFRGREMAHIDLGRRILDRLVEDLGDRGWRGASASMSDAPTATSAMAGRRAPITRPARGATPPRSRSARRRGWRTARAAIRMARTSGRARG